jgi:hypothetical protein
MLTIVAVAHEDEFGWMKAGGYSGPLQVTWTSSRAEPWAAVLGGA